MNKFCLSELGRSLKAGSGSKKGPGPLLSVKLGDIFSFPCPNLGGTAAVEALFLPLGAAGALAPGAGAVTPPRALGPAAGAAAAAGAGVGSAGPPPPVVEVPVDPGSLGSFGLLFPLLRIDRRFEICLIIPRRLPLPHRLYRRVILSAVSTRIRLLSTSTPPFSSAARAAADAFAAKRKLASKSSTTT